MSFRTVSASPTTSNVGLNTKKISNVDTVSSASTDTAWVRNPSWLTLPSVSSSEEKVVGLYAVYPNANFIALNCSGDYTVNWGDGTTENVTAASQAEHEYDFNDVDLANTNAPVTFTDSGDTVNRTSHGYTNGMTVSFSSITTTTGIVAGQIYYVVNATSNTFQVSSSENGTPLTLTTDGTGIILPYKQVIVTITPQAGQTLSAVQLDVKHSQTTLQSYSTGWLELIISGPNITTLTIGVVNTFLKHYNIEKINILSLGANNDLNTLCANLVNLRVFNIPSNTSVINVIYMFQNCYNLTSVPLFNTASVTSMSNMFQNCFNLISVPLFNTANVTYMFAMFNNCYNLTSVPLFNTAAVTDMGSMFNGCTGLTSVPLFNTASVTSMQAMFQNCYNLTSVPLFNTANVTNSMFAMFSGCTGLTSVPLFNTASVTSMQSIFDGCNSLTSVPLFNTASVTNMTSMFSSCLALTSVPLFNTASVTSMSNMFQNCRNLKSVPLFNTASVTNMSSMFSGCFSLKSVPLFNTANVLTMDSMFTTCSKLISIPLFDTTKVTNMGIMLNNCYSLKSVPLFNTANVTSMSNMLRNCNSLTYVPLFDTTKVTNMSNMFQNCFSLTYVPLFNTAAVTNMSTMFGACGNLQEVPALVTTAVTASSGFTNMFNTCPSLSRIQAKNFRFTFSVASCKLSATALNEIYTNLPTVTGQTITVSNNYGTASDDPTIATAKGWTVTG
jgi:surface protein